MRGSRALGSLVVVALAAACGPAREAPSGELDASFGQSARAAGVPRDLLVAIAHVEDGLGAPRLREPDPDAHVVAAGPLMLRRGRVDTLARAAELSGHAEIELRADADLALAAGAKVLAELGARTGARPDDLASWAPAVGEMSGYADAAHRDDYVHRVFAVLASGGALPGREGQVVAIAPHADLPPSLTIDLGHRLRALAGTPDYPGAEWVPTSCTNKCTIGRAGNKVDYVVIHDTEGGWDASVATLQNDPGKSVQYLVGKDGRLAQFVSEGDTAWHAGNFWYNQRSVGIEHVGYSTQPYTEAQYAKSAALVGHLLAKYAIPRDRAHVIGHDQIPNGDKIAQSSPACALSPKACRTSGNYGGAGVHGDPGVWEWATYMPRVGGAAKCTDVTDVLACSVDEKSAFRCDGGKVVVTRCDGAGGCEAAPSGVVCHVAPASTSSSGGSSGSSGASSSSGEPAPPLPTPPAKSPGAGADTSATYDAPAEGSGGGCRASSGRTTSIPAMALALVAGLALARRRASRKG